MEISWKWQKFLGRPHEIFSTQDIFNPWSIMLEQTSHLHAVNTCLAKKRDVFHEKLIIYLAQRMHKALCEVFLWAQNCEEVIITNEKVRK